MKKIFLLLLIFITFTIPVHAGDMPESLISDKSAKIFTAIVLDVNKDSVNLKVVRKLKGGVTENETLSLPYFKYFGTKDNEPSKNDCCIISVVNGKSFYSYKTTSTDPRTLKFINLLTNASMNMTGKSQDERYQKYVNNGDYEKSDQILKSEANADIKTSPASINPEAIKDMELPPDNNNHHTFIYWLLGAVLLLLITFLIIIKKRK
ncbi:MAG TPA: hypothetical protein VF941_04255 [Clostridia bacterium]